MDGAQAFAAGRWPTAPQERRALAERRDALAAVAHNAGWTGAGFRAAWMPRAAPGRQDACGQQRVMSEAADSPVSAHDSGGAERGRPARHGDGGSQRRRSRQRAGAQPLRAGWHRSCAGASRRTHPRGRKPSVSGRSEAPGEDGQDSPEAAGAALAAQRNGAAEAAQWSGA